jgi:hypothetical protein
VAIDVLGGLDLAMTHLVRHLHVGRTRGDHERGADVAQLVGGIGDLAVLVRGRESVCEREVLPPGRVTEVSAPVAVDQPGVQPPAALLTALGSALQPATSTIDPAATL